MNGRRLFDHVAPHAASSPCSDAIAPATSTASSEAAHSSAVHVDERAARYREQIRAALLANVERHTRRGR